MGFLRFFLALAVFTSHGGKLLDFSAINGKIAVESFFIVSGFYMSMVI